MLAKGGYSSAIAALDNSPSKLFTDCELNARRHLLQAVAYDRLGQDSKVESSMREASQPCPQGSLSLTEDIAIRRGELLDDPATAESDYRFALGIDRQLGDSFREARALLDLCNAAQLEERYDESIAWGVAALNISKSKGYKVLEEISEGNLAWNYYKLGDFSDALPLSLQAEELARVIGEGPERIRRRNNIGMIHEQLGQFALAESEYRDALSMAEQQGDKAQAAIALAEIAFVAVRAGKWEVADEFSKQAIESARQQTDRPLELQALFAQGLIASHNSDQDGAKRLLTEVAFDPHHDRQSLRWEAQTALADLYAKEQNFKAAEAEYRAALDTAGTARCSIHKEDLRLPFFANTTLLYDSYIDFLVREGKTVEALRAADQSRALTLAEGLGVEGKRCLAYEASFAPQQVAKQLQSTMLFYWVGAAHSYLWAVTPQETKLYSLPPRAEIEPRILAYRRALVGSRDVLQTEDSNGEQLYQMLVAPAAELFHPNGRVIVITDGQLSGLSFESLIAPQPEPHYWIEDVTLENASSLRLLLARPKARRIPGSKLLLIGNPVPPDRGGQYSVLPHAAEEISAVGQYFPASEEEVYQQGNATAEAYIASDPGHFRYIHFVAHGDANSTDPLESAVVLSAAASSVRGVNASYKDASYKLYARDVIAHPLQAELVTISACKGAGERAYTGEGLVGLSWAFLHAGAHNVIGALWDISDVSTPELMRTMYSELAKGSSPDTALRAAKLSLLHGQSYRKPVYWAAFQLYTGS
ncbi:hypothetical protein ACPOL_5453 [Acidisarcina polymorpha]|uniref:CHAT domain-containing protein n=1 Tax=Acidisarcina polymorpha TaxID=2211140 RepID=A0A2Z5G6H5_9BACT|nr:CHAT domain-containing protein [Acidisarcina polymorpha]AXC14701.1 hypothetical protein ACPOL_5453 [Acidisarcina polymorpha]